MIAKTLTIRIFETAARLQPAGFVMTRIGLMIVLLWIGGLKFCKYEAQSIVPFVANSPLMSFFYAEPHGYHPYMNSEGAVIPENIIWHHKNHTYTFAYGLGTAIVVFGLLVGFHPWLPQVAAFGGFIIFLMSLTTLSFLITTPECWVHTAGDSGFGFPFLSGAGRLVVKDFIMMGAAVVVMSDSAKAWLRKQQPQQ